MRLTARSLSGAFVACLCLGLATWSCSAPPPLEPESPQPKPTENAEDQLPAGSVDRGMLEAVLRQGPPWALERIPIEEVMEEGKFKGWRIIDLPMEWAHVDLRPGDIVLAINDVGLEKPEDLFSAWVAMSAAKEIRISCIREKDPHEVVIPVFGDPDPKLSARLSEQAAAMAGGGADAGAPADAEAGSPPAPRPAAPSGRKETIVIKGNEPLPSESTVSY